MKANTIHAPSGGEALYQEAPWDKHSFVTKVFHAIYALNTKNADFLLPYWHKVNMMEEWDPRVLYNNVLIDPKILPADFYNYTGEDLSKNEMFECEENPDSDLTLSMLSITDKIMSNQGTYLSFLNFFVTKELVGGSPLREIITLFMAEKKRCVRFFIPDIKKFFDQFGVDQIITTEAELFSIFRWNVRHPESMFPKLVRNLDEGYNIMPSTEIEAIILRNGFEILPIKDYLIEMLV